MPRRITPKRRPAGLSLRRGPLRGIRTLPRCLLKLERELESRKRDRDRELQLELRRLLPKVHTNLGARAAVKGDPPVDPVTAKSEWVRQSEQPRGVGAQLD